jgi:hypothetical protein
MMKVTMVMKRNAKGSETVVLVNGASVINTTPVSAPNTRNERTMRDVMIC